MKAILTTCVLIALVTVQARASLTYPVVDTAQQRCYNNTREISPPAPARDFYGQDAQYDGLAPAYRNNGDGTVTDLNTGLMWQQDPGTKVTYDQAVAGTESCRTGGYTDWRLPTIKELYSLIRFDGEDPNMQHGGTGGVPFIDDAFNFTYGQAADGDRLIDSQFATATIYLGTVMHGQQAMFGVNFADGRIKGYPTGATPRRGKKTFYALYVRGNPEYGQNRFTDNRDGTITDHATGLTWQQADSTSGMDWHDALVYAEDLSLAGHTDWRLPNAKELQSIVDYSRSPDATRSAAIDPLFKTSSITNEAGQPDFPWYWTSTTHASANGRGNAAAYIAFGRALGFMHGRWIDVHGAGCQRSDPKTGNPQNYPRGRGPQGDAIRIFNYVRCVRGGTAE
jgi:hypothetical protein